MQKDHSFIADYNHLFNVYAVTFPAWTQSLNSKI